MHASSAGLHFGMFAAANSNQNRHQFSIVIRRKRLFLTHFRAPYQFATFQITIYDNSANLLKIANYRRLHSFQIIINELIIIWRANRIYRRAHCERLSAAPLYRIRTRIELDACI